MLKVWINFVPFHGYLTVDQGRFNFEHTVEVIQEAILTPVYMLTPSDLQRPNSAQYYWTVHGIQRRNFLHSTRPRLPKATIPRGHFCVTSLNARTYCLTSSPSSLYSLIKCRQNAASIYNGYNRSHLITMQFSVVNKQSVVTINIGALVNHCNKKVSLR